jgi:hypothetical protein
MKKGEAMIFQILALDHQEKIALMRECVERIQDPPGVDYSPHLGVICPLCGGELRGGRKVKTVTRVTAWKDGMRTRYHSCPICGLKFKSIETAGGTIGGNGK